MTNSLESTQPALTRRELREREREAERAALRAERAVTANETAAPATAPEQPASLSRRERRELERAAEREAQLRAAAERAAAATQRPELFAVATDAPATVAPKPAAAPSGTNFTTEIVETLHPDTAPIELAPVISLDEMREVRVPDAEALPEAPRDEPEIPASFLREATNASGTALPFISRSSGASRFGGSMVALSLVAGTAVLGAGSAAAIGALNSDGSSQGYHNGAGMTQSLTVDSNAEEAAPSRTEESTAVTSLGTATAANLANGMRLTDSSTYQNDLTANVQWPFPVGVEFTDGYGPRNGPVGTSSFHGGQDFTPGEGTPIGSIADGIVKNIDEGSTSLGVTVEVEHVIMGQRVTSLYAHLDPSTIKVAVGDTVQVGDELAGVGNTGISTGPHLHLEIHVNGNYVNPVTFLAKLNVSGVDVTLPTSLSESVIGGVDEKLEDAASVELIDELFTSKLS